MKQPANSSELVAALLEDELDPKDYAYDALPSALDDALAEVKKRVSQELNRRRGPVALPDMHDRAIEIAGEVATERGLGSDPFFDQLLGLVLREYT